MSEKLYIILDEYKADFDGLSSRFKAKYNTEDHEEFLREELKKYVEYLAYLEGKKVNNPDRSFMDFYFDFKTAYSDLSRDYKREHELPIFDSTPGFSATEPFDKTFLRIRLNEIVHFLQSKMSSVASSNSNLQPLDFNLNQTDLVHFFDLLVDADIVKEPSDVTHKNGGFYPKLAKFFTARGKAINPNSAKSTKTNKKDKAIKYSKSYYQMLRGLKRTIEDKLSE
ncbi:hypothetical protein [Robiginitalea sp. SC105]|uniref:hypothetical protein n=1 Tax=Robiginitalea sp. SC105 TaxID=2762332 RepID=UPI00163AE24B|nr:hypothetical protein [Robiginitalea sp. SC105]MBC2838862.1 hypothetical protein [Robiginitalea sp. SC105]